jgi:hypothetical protein
MGVPEGLQVHADLVGAPRLRPDLETREARDVLDHAPAAHRGARPRRTDGHLEPVRAVTSDRPLDRSFGTLEAPPDDRLVGLLDLAALEGGRERAVRAIRFRDEDQARGPAVEPVHDPGTLGPADARERTRAREQRVDERAGLFARARMDDHPDGLSTTSRSASSCTIDSGIASGNELGGGARAGSAP